MRQVNDLYVSAYIFLQRSEVDNTGGLLGGKPGNYKLEIQRKLLRVFIFRPCEHIAY